MQNLIVTLPVHLSRSLLLFLSSIKFLLLRKTGFQFCLTDEMAWCVLGYQNSCVLFSWCIITLWGKHGRYYIISITQVYTCLQDLEQQTHQAELLEPG